MSNLWLLKQLRRADGVDVQSDGEFFPLKLSFSGRVESIYVPDSSEYIVSGDVVQKAHEMGATIISYPDLWASATVEAKAYGKELKVSVMKHGALFGYLRSKGVGI